MLIVDVRVEWCPGAVDGESGTGQQQPRTVYRVCLTSRGPDRAAPRVRWTVLRRYSEFEAVEHRLAEVVCGDGRTPLPGKALGHAAWQAATGLLSGIVRGTRQAPEEDAEFCRTRAAGLDAWAKDVRCLLEESSVSRAHWADPAIKAFFDIPPAVLALLAEQSPIVRPLPIAIRAARTLRSFRSGDEIAVYARTEAIRAVSDVERAVQQRAAAEARGTRTDAFDRVCARAAMHARDAIHTIEQGLKTHPSADLFESCAMLALRLEKAYPTENGSLDDEKSLAGPPLMNEPIPNDRQPPPKDVTPDDIKNRLAQQDARVQGLAKAAQRQRAAGESLSAEVDAQNEALDRLRDEAARTDAKISSARGSMRRL